MGQRIDVIATTISGSISDWGKVKQIVPLFRGHGETEVTLYTADSHREARETACRLVQSGSRTVISAGGSGTFNSVIEGCYDSGVDLTGIRLGFLRKGSADLIGKVLGMPDTIEEAVEVFVRSIRDDRVVPCDVLQVSSGGGEPPSRRFVGYGGAEIFGEIPYYTENRYIKYYKGILGQLFGDLGPFFVGTNMAILARLFGSARRAMFLVKRGEGARRRWTISVDGSDVSEGIFQAMIVVNGDLGPNLPFARSVPLGSGDFHLFALRDMGIWNIYRQMKHAFDATIMNDPARWGFESFRIGDNLILRPDDGGVFPVNVDGSTMLCRQSARFEIVDRINLISR